MNPRLKIILILISINIYACLQAEVGVVDADDQNPRDYYVAVDGSDYNPGSEEKPWRTVQKAARSATPGSTVYVKEGVYKEKVIITVSGNSSAGFITFQAFPGHKVIIDGSDRKKHRDTFGDCIIYIENKDYIRIKDFEIAGSKVHDGSGIRIYDSADHIQIVNNKIHDIKGTSAMGITVYGKGATPIQNLLIKGNEIYNCEPAPSEAVALNGNVKDFEITDNIIHDVNNIGIDMIGGERWLSSQVVRRGICSGNTVYRARSSYEDGYAAGIYVDGGNNIIIERNRVFECDLGIEVGAENNGVTVEQIIVRNNLVYNNDKAGIAVGAFSRGGGTVTGCTIINNTLYKNNKLTAQGELWLQYVSDLEIVNNLLYSAHNGNKQAVLLSSLGYLKNSSIRVDYNLFYAENLGSDDDIFLIGRDTYSGLKEYIQKTGQDTHSSFGDPRFLALPQAGKGGFTLAAASPARNAGLVHQAQGEYDYYGSRRLQGSAVDIGAVEQK
ncbi:MAG: right-handed parallel beta-helix repeat-containing protein [Spirochaetales bacterium]|nr:right-handed parallel beta-helix repeat-containing protein [Spirochaetales bacterium]